MTVAVLAWIMRKQLKDQCNTHIFVIILLAIFKYCSFKISLGNMTCLEGNIATVIFQYSIVENGS